MPKRLQRKHWRERLPPGSKLVARPSFFGNEYSVEEYGRAEALRLFIATHEQDASYRARVRRELAGLDLVCYCDLEAPCHADVLLRWANEAVLARLVKRLAPATLEAMV
jgi:hypothetical protein